MHIIYTAFILNYYKLISLSCIIIKHINNLIIIINILMITSLYKNYIIIIVYFKKLTKHLNVKSIINIVKMKLFNNCFNK